jgi:hypothetical protein
VTGAFHGEAATFAETMLVIIILFVLPQYPSDQEISVNQFNDVNSPPFVKFGLKRGRNADREISNFSMVCDLKKPGTIR